MYRIDGVESKYSIFPRRRSMLERNDAGSESSFVGRRR